MIEKVGYTRPTAAPRATRRTGAAGGANFADALSQAAAADGVDAPPATAPLSSVGALLGAQEVSADELRRRKYIRRGKITLDALEQLRDALLMGSLPLSTLTRLEQLVAEERAETSDPVLQAVLDEIELRAAVELAKLEVAGLLSPRAP